MATESMTERLDDIVGEMREGCSDGNCRVKPKPNAMHTNGGCRCLRDLAGNLDRILAAAALERAEHRRQLDEALGEPTEDEFKTNRLGLLIDPGGYACRIIAAADFIASRRSRLLKEG